MANFQEGKPQAFSSTGKLLLPGVVLLTGTFSSTGKLVTGVGTLFTSELLYLVNQLKYKYLWDSAGNRLAEIDYVVNDTKLWLKLGFSSNVGAGALMKVNDPAKRYRMIKIVGTGAFIISTPDQAPVTWPAAQPFDVTNMNSGLEPFAIDASGTTASIDALI